MLGPHHVGPVPHPGQSGLGVEPHAAHGAPAVRANSHKPIVSTPPTKSKAVGRAKFSTLVEDRVVMAALAEMKNYDSMAKLESGDA